MRVEKITLCALVIVIFVVNSQVMAWTQYNDGATYDITTTINDDVWVDYLSPGMQTTVNLLSEGSVSGELQGYHDSQINIVGGSVGGSIYLYDKSQMAISNGLLGGSSLEVYGSSQVTMNGGLLDCAYFRCYDNTQIMIYDGRITGKVYSNDNSIVTVNGGSLQAMQTIDGQIVFNEGTIHHVFKVFGYGQVTMNGGSAWILGAFDNGHFTINGGSSSILGAWKNSQTDWYGGEISEEIAMSDDAILNIYGHDFEIDGIPAGYGEIVSIFGGVNGDEPLRRLTGTLKDGSLIDVPFLLGGSSHINLLPVTDTITVQAPNGGELYVLGTEHDITWSSHGEIDNVLLEYSLDNGTAWTELGSVSNTGSYIWTTPHATSTECLVRITDADDPTTNDISDAVFEITPYAEVYFADANLKAAVEAELGIENPNTNDMLSLTRLDARSSDIAYLTGLEYAENLSVLYLFSNAITDFEPITQLQNLTYVHLAYNQIDVIPDLSNWTKINYLYLYGNIIRDISPLTIPEITTLRYLYIYDNETLPIEAYRDYIPTIQANNPKLTNFRYDFGCEPMIVGDLNNDCTVNLADFAIMASNWIRCTHIYQELCP